MCRAGQLTSWVPAAVLCAQLDACLLGLEVAQQPVACHLHQADAGMGAVLASSLSEAPKEWWWYMCRRNLRHACQQGPAIRANLVHLWW